MNEHFLRLNQTKTKILVLAPPSVQKEIVIRGVFLEGTCIRFVDSAKNLGVILDEVLSFETQVNSVIKSSFANLKKLHQIKGYMSEDERKQLACSYALAQLDYCNSLYFGINKSLFNKLQRVQNCAARLVCKQRIPSGGLQTKFLDLHWLQVKHRVYYKVLLIIHKCLMKNAPEEVMALLSYGDSTRTGHLVETRCFSKYGERAFSHYGPKIWNLLPKDMRLELNTNDFKKKLKTYLFVSGEDLSQRLDCQ